MADIRNRLEKIAEQKAFYNPDYEYEAKNIIDEWNKLVPAAEKSGISHEEIKDIWDVVEWGEYLDVYDDDND